MTLRETRQRNGDQRIGDFMVNTIRKFFLTKLHRLCLSFSFVLAQVTCVDVEETEDRVHYDGYQVIRALPHTQDQLDTLHTIGESMSHTKIFHPSIP